MRRPGSLSVASHVHHPSQVKLAARRGIPTLLVIRDPVPCLASYLIAGPHGLPRQVLKEYIEYHTELLPYLDRVVVADFEEITQDMGGVIARLNSRFGIDLPMFHHTEENVRSVFDAVDARHREVYPASDTERGVPRPSPRRSPVNEAHRERLNAPELADLVEEAKHLRALYLGAETLRQL